MKKRPFKVGDVARIKQTTVIFDVGAVDTSPSGASIQDRESGTWYMANFCEHAKRNPEVRLPDSVAARDFWSLNGGRPLSP